MEEAGSRLSLLQEGRQEGQVPAGLGLLWAGRSGLLPHEGLWGGCAAGGGGQGAPPPHPSNQGGKAWHSLAELAKEMHSREKGLNPHTCSCGAFLGGGTSPPCKLPNLLAKRIASRRGSELKRSGLRGGGTEEDTNFLSFSTELYGGVFGVFRGGGERGLMGQANSLCQVNNAPSPDDPD